MNIAKTFLLLGFLFTTLFLNTSTAADINPDCGDEHNGDLIKGLCVSHLLSSETLYNPSVTNMMNYECQDGFEPVAGFSVPICVAKVVRPLFRIHDDLVFVDPNPSKGCPEHFVGLGNGKYCIDANLVLTLVKPTSQTDIVGKTPPQIVQLVHNSSLENNGEMLNGRCPRGYARTTNGGLMGGSCIDTEILFEAGDGNRYGFDPINEDCHQNWKKVKEGGFCIPKMSIIPVVDGCITYLEPYITQSIQDDFDYGKLSFHHFPAIFSDNRPFDFIFFAEPKYMSGDTRVQVLEIQPELHLGIEIPVQPWIPSSTFSVPDCTDGDPMLTDVSQTIN